MSRFFGKALRETGELLQEVGLTIASEDTLRKVHSNHRPLLNLFEKRPIASAGTFIAPNASVVGTVTLQAKSSVWYGAVIRGDVGSISIGTGSNIQDNAVISTIPTSSEGSEESDSSNVFIGFNVTVGHGAVIKSSTIHSNVLIGQGAVVESGCVINKNAIIAAGAVLLPGTFVKQGQLFAGNPATYIRDVTEEEIKNNETIAIEYSSRATEHAAALEPLLAQV